MAVQHLFFNDFSGGVNLHAGRLNQRDNECDAIQNGELSKSGPIQKIRGYTDRGAAVNSGYDILGLCSGYKSDGTTKQIAICDGLTEADAYTYNTITNTWTPHRLSLSAGAKAEFEYFLDGFFMVNFSDATRWNNFVSWSTTTNVTDAPKAKYIKLYNSRIYLFYVVVDGTTYTSRCIYSDLPSGSPYTISWNNADNKFDVDSDDGDVGNGLEVNSNRLLLFKENKLFRYDENNLYQVPGCPGTVSNRSIKNIQGWTLYLHSSGLWGYNGSTSTLLSRKIADVIEGISTKNFSNACAYVKGDHYYLYLNDIVNERTGLTVTKAMIDYDISNNAFTWRSYNVTPTVFLEYRDDRSTKTYDDATITYNDANISYNAIISSEPRIYFGTDDGYVKEFEKTNAFDETAIAFMVETKDYYLKSPSQWKLLQKIIVYTNDGKGMTVQYKMDDKDWVSLGRISKVQQELTFPVGSRCQRVKFRFLEMSTGSQFYLEGIDIYFRVEGEIE